VRYLGNHQNAHFEAPKSSKIPRIQRSTTRVVLFVFQDFSKPPVFLKFPWQITNATPMVTNGHQRAEALDAFLGNPLDFLLRLSHEFPEV